MSKSEQAARVLEPVAQAESATEEAFTVERIQAWLVNYLARVLDMPSGAVETSNTFQSFGLDSAAAVGLTGDLARWLGTKLEPTLAYDYPTIDALAEHLAATRG